MTWPESYSSCEQWLSGRVLTSCPGIPGAPGMPGIGSPVPCSKPHKHVVAHTHMTLMRRSEKPAATQARLTG